MKTLKNYLYNLSFQLLTIILPIITTPYVSRILQVDGVGRYSVSYAVTNYFVLFGLLGFSGYGNREIAYVRNNKEEKIQTFWEINNARFLTMGLSTLVYVVYVICAVSPELKMLYAVQGFTLAASWVDISWYYTGTEEFKTTALRNIAVKLFSVVLIFSFVKQKSDLVLYALIISASAFAGNVFLWKGIDIRGDFKWRRTRKGKTVYHLKRTMGLWIPALAINVFAYLDKIMLGFICDETQVGLYESSDKIARMAVYAVTSFTSVILPKTANLYANNQIGEFKEKIHYALSFVMMLAIPISFGIMGISKTIVPWFFGQGYAQVEYLLLISSWLTLTLGLSSVFGNAVLIALNREKQYTFAVVVAAVLNILENIILIPKFQAYGALIATVMSEYTNMLIMMFFAREFFDMKSFLQSFAKYVLLGIFMGVITYSIGLVLEPKMLTTFLQILVGVLVYCVSLLLVRDKNMLLFLRMVRRK